MSILFPKLTLRQRIHEWLEGEREIRAYYGSMGAHGPAAMREDDRREHQLLVECYEREAPHITRVGIELIIFINVVLFNVEMFLYILTGRVSRSWKLEIERQLCEEADEQLLSYAY